MLEKWIINERGNFAYNHKRRKLIMSICLILVIVLLIISVFLSFTNQPRAIEFALWAIALILLCAAKVSF